MADDGELKGLLHLQDRCKAGALHEHPPVRLGELMVAAGVITQDQLQSALAKQSEWRDRIGEVLVRMGLATEALVKKFLALQQRLIAALMIVAIGATAICFSPAVEAAGPSQASAKIEVRATVLKHVSVKALSSPQSVTITKQDIDRGFIDIATPSAIEVRTNSAEGYMLNFQSSLDGVNPVVINAPGRGGGVLSADRVLQVSRPISGMTVDQHELQWRLQLTPAVAPGTYAWPVALNVHPI